MGKLTPIQMPHIEMDELKKDRKAFTKEEWIDVLIRSTGMEPDKLSDRVKWLLSNADRCVGFISMSSPYLAAWLKNSCTARQGINLTPTVYFFTKVSPYVVYTSYGDFLMIEILTDSPYNRDEVGGKQPLL